MQVTVCSQSIPLSCVHYAHDQTVGSDRIITVAQLHFPLSEKDSISTALLLSDIPLTESLEHRLLVTPRGQDSSGALLNIGTDRSAFLIQESRENAFTPNNTFASL